MKAVSKQKKPASKGSGFFDILLQNKFFSGNIYQGTFIILLYPAFFLLNKFLFISIKISKSVFNNHFEYVF